MPPNKKGIEDMPESNQWVNKIKLIIKVKSIVLSCLNSGKNMGGFRKIVLTAVIKNDKPNNSQGIEEIEDISLLYHSVNIA